MPGIAAASIKGSWEVKKGTTGTVLLMNNPRMKHITPDVLGKLASIKLLQSKNLVMKVFYCPAFSLYLSDTSAGGEKISMALLASAPVVEPVGSLEASFKWWSNTQTGLVRHGCKKEHVFTPLYELLHVRQSRNRQSSPSPERTGEQLWTAPPVPWAPLSEDGTEVPIYINGSVTPTRAPALPTPAPALLDSPRGGAPPAPRKTAVWTAMTPPHGAMTPPLA
ncbi:uncharacterized protein F5147DRAFT_653970 [Suillus discolor]|uniref:Uncharacterized protein n=1 Tax=Suillus discolor TaxID=1912936 RepID=A0A9P7F3Y9_9AGAM|nr:uncharacterized protein F5147DRAFT_653970 [Suillus discolor]KAG2106220.1 hypothetical protein F5147DRAFT_653970 [Suillus discolor]